MFVCEIYGRGKDQLLHRLAPIPLSIVVWDGTLGVSPSPCPGSQFLAVGLMDTVPSFLPAESQRAQFKLAVFHCCAVSI